MQKQNAINQASIFSKGTLHAKKTSLDGNALPITIPWKRTAIHLLKMDGLEDVFHPPFRGKTTPTLPGQPEETDSLTSVNVKVQQVWEQKFSKGFYKGHIYIYLSKYILICLYLNIYIYIYIYTIHMYVYTLYTHV